MLAERLDEQTFHLMMMGFLALGALLAIVWALLDNRRALQTGEEPATSPGDVTTIPADQHHQLLRARFERMDGVL